MERTLVQTKLKRIEIVNYTLGIKLIKRTEKQEFIATTKDKRNHLTMNS